MNTIKMSVPKSIKKYMYIYYENYEHIKIILK